MQLKSCNSPHNGLEVQMLPYPVYRSIAVRVNFHKYDGKLIIIRLRKEKNKSKHNKSVNLSLVDLWQ